MVLTYFRQLYVSVSFLNRLVNLVSMNCNSGLTLKNKSEKTSRVRREEINDVARSSDVV